MKKNVAFFTMDCSVYPAERVHGNFKVVRHAKYDVWKNKEYIGCYDKLSGARARIEREEI